MARAPDLAVGQRVYAPEFGIFKGKVTEINDENECSVIIFVDDDEANHHTCFEEDAFDGKWNEANQQWELEA